MSLRSHGSFEPTAHVQKRGEKDRPSYPVCVPMTHLEWCLLTSHREDDVLAHLCWLNEYHRQRTKTCDSKMISKPNDLTKAILVIAFWLACSQVLTATPAGQERRCVPAVLIGLV